MSYQGMMDGWHGDEFDFQDDDRYYELCDEQYEASRDDELFN